MAIIKFVNSGSPMNNIFNYVTRDEATERKLIDGLNCSPETVLEEFRFVKGQYGKNDGRSYYHIIQSFAPDDKLSVETAHEIGMRLAEYFPDYQVLVATHDNTKCLHNHLVMNSVSYKNGKKFHQSRDDMLRFKEYSNKLCQAYGLSVTEVTTKNPRLLKWKRELIDAAYYALKCSETKEEFIEEMKEQGYGVRWEDDRKYITFTTPDGQKCRDIKLFDECLLKRNLEIYFELGGCEGTLVDEYLEYETPEHNDCYRMTYSNGLINMLGDIFASIPSDFHYYYTPDYINEINPFKKRELERLLGRRITNEAFVYYSTQEGYEREMGLSL